MKGSARGTAGSGVSGMKDTPTRVFAVMCVLVVVWTTVYWLYEPAEPPVTLDQTPAPRGTSGELTQGPMAEVTPPIAPVERRPAMSATPAPRSIPPEQPRTRVIPPEFYDYTVQRGDTLETIARKLLGDGRLWTKIAEANGLRDPNKLVPGKTTLRIPKDPTNIQGKEVPIPIRSSPAAQQPATEPPPPTPPAREPPPAVQEYVVRRGDTLSGIAKAFYGKSALWRVIYEANQDVIDDPDQVKPGITIKIPPQQE